MSSFIRCACAVLAILFLLVAVPSYSKDDFAKPKEFGIYIKTGKGLKRLIPNIVFEEKGLLYVEANNPAHYLLKDVEFFVIYGKHDMKSLTINPLLFFQPSTVGKSRFIFGKELPFESKKRGEDLYTIKPKGLLGRGYTCLWINDTAWDFIIE